MAGDCTLSVGHVLKGRNYTYRIVKVLGQGSFGITYLAAVNVQLQGPLGTVENQMPVAIKEFFMSDINGRDGSSWENVTCSNSSGLFDNYKRKFMTEAQNLSQMNHPGIVKVLELFEANNTVYYAMEYLGDRSLDKHVTECGGESPAEAVDHIRQVAQALEYMHQKRVLHLDLKPSNIMLRGGNRTVLIDFGLSKQYNSKGEAEHSTTIGAGTQGYAPVEQSEYRADGSLPVTLDIYALGATLFKLLTGKRPMSASQLLNEGFPTQELSSRGVPQPLINIVKRAMAVAKKDRYQSVGEFIDALDSLSGKSQSSRKSDESTTCENTNRDEKTQFEPPKVKQPKANNPQENKSEKSSPKPQAGRSWFNIITPLLVGLAVLIYNLIDISGYRVGDYYNENGLVGIVFETWGMGRHGKIVSLNETCLQWSTENRYIGSEIPAVVNANQGKIITDRVLEKYGGEKYPAFKWCRDKGSEWYLPTKEELLEIDDNFDAINDKLTKWYPAAPLRVTHYLSSDEYYEENPKECCYKVFVDGDNVQGWGNHYKTEKGNVRAVAVF